MQIAIAHMPEGSAVNARRNSGKGGIQIGNRGRQIGHLKADVVHHPFAMRDHCQQHIFAHRPHIGTL